MTSTVVGAVAVSTPSVACTITVYVPAGVAAEGWMRMVDEPPAGDGDGIGFGSKVTVISPPGGGVGEMLATESVTSALNPVGPPSAVTYAVDVLVLQAWPPDDTTSGERPGTDVMQSP